MKLLIIAFILSLLSCTPNSTVKEKHDKQFLRINTRSEPRSLDPRCSKDLSTSTVLVMLYDGLFRMDANNKPIPSLVEKLKISKDKKRYTFYLNKTYWSDNSPVTAHDFIYSWQSSLMPDFPSENTQHLYLLKNGRKIKLGSLPKEALGVKALSDKILQVDLEEPTPYFLELLSHPIFFPIPKHIDINTPNWMNSSTHFIGNGPFTIEKWSHGNTIIVKKNPLYWDHKKVRLNHIQISMVEDEHTEFYMFENGELDWAGSPNSSIPHDALESLKASKQLHISPMAENFCFKFNTKAAPFDNQKIRKAFCLAMNRKRIIDNVLQAEQIPALRFLPPMTVSTPHEYYKDHSTEQAITLFKEGLKEMNLTKEQLPKITLTYTRCEKHQRTAEALQQQWQETFGIPIRLQSYEWNVFLEQLRNHHYQIAGRGWVADYIDGINFLQNYQYLNSDPLGGDNDTFWTNSKFSNLLEEAKKTVSIKKREQYLIDAEKILMEEFPIAPFLFAQQCYVCSPSLTNVILTPTCRLDFKWAYFNTTE